MAIKNKSKLNIVNNFDSPVFTKVVSELELVDLL